MSETGHKAKGATKSLDDLRSPGRGMNFGRASIAKVASVLVPLLAEISRGETSLTAEMVLEIEREDSEWARVMTALLMLHGDVTYRIKATEMDALQRQQEARNLAVHLLLSAICTDVSDPSTLSDSGAQLQTSVRRELASMRALLGSMPAGETTTKQLRAHVEALEKAVEVRSDAEPQTPSQQAVDSSLVVALMKLRVTAAEMLSHVERVYECAMGRVGVEAEMIWLSVPEAIRMWWVRGLTLAAMASKSTGANITGVGWSNPRGSDARASSLHLTVRGEDAALDEFGDNLARWLTSIESVITTVTGGAPWTLARKGGHFTIGMDGTATVEPITQRYPYDEARPMRIVVVDDEPIIGSVVHRVLTRYLSFPCEIKVFVSSEEALAFVLADEDENVDLVISDINMPKLSGAELYEHVVDARPSMSNRFLFISGMELEGALLEPFRLGMVDFVRKPFRPEELSSSVTRVIDRLVEFAAAE